MILKQAQLPNARVCGKLVRSGPVVVAAQVIAYTNSLRKQNGVWREFCRIGMDVVIQIWMSAIGR
jgi:hypothetical protein